MIGRGDPVEMWQTGLQFRTRALGRTGSKVGAAQWSKEWIRGLR
jgi:hypothetical protein